MADGTHGYGDITRTRIESGSEPFGPHPARVDRDDVEDRMYLISLEDKKKGAGHARENPDLVARVTKILYDLQSKQKHATSWDMNQAEDPPITGSSCSQPATQDPSSEHKIRDATHGPGGHSGPAAGGAYTYLEQRKEQGGHKNAPLGIQVTSPPSNYAKWREQAIRLKQMSSKAGQKGKGHPRAARKRKQELSPANARKREGHRKTEHAHGRESGRGDPLSRGSGPRPS